MMGVPSNKKELLTDTIFDPLSFHETVPLKGIVQELLRFECAYTYNLVLLQTD